MASNPIVPALLEPGKVTTSVFGGAHPPGSISIRRKAANGNPAGVSRVIQEGFDAAPAGKTLIVCMGDSLTQQLDNYYGAGGSTPSQIQNLWTTGRATVLNRGIATQTLEQMDARFNADVLAYYNNKTYDRHICYIAGGDNDKNAGRTVAQAVANTNAMIQRGVAGGFRMVVVLMHDPQWTGTTSPFAIEYGNYYKDPSNKAALGYDGIVDLLADPIARYDDLNVAALRPYWTQASGQEDRQHFGPALAARRAILISAVLEQVNLLPALPPPPVGNGEFIIDPNFTGQITGAPGAGWATNGNVQIINGELVWSSPAGDTAYTQVGGLTVGEQYVLRINVSAIVDPNNISINLSELGGNGNYAFTGTGLKVMTFTATQQGGYVYIQGGNGGGVGRTALSSVSLLHA